MILRSGSARHGGCLGLSSHKAMPKNSQCSKVQLRSSKRNGPNKSQNCSSWHFELRRAYASVEPSCSKLLWMVCPPKCGVVEGAFELHSFGGRRLCLGPYQMERDFAQMKLLLTWGHARKRQLLITSHRVKLLNRTSDRYVITPAVKGSNHW